MKTKLLLIILVLASCSLISDKNKILTAQEWILEYSYEKTGSDGVSPAEEFYYKKSTRYIVWKFGAHSLESNLQRGEVVESSLWSWKDNNKKTLVIDDGRFAGEYQILELKSDCFSVTKWDIGEGDQLILKFRTASSDGWAPDEQVKSINEMLKAEQ